MEAKRVCNRQQIHDNNFVQEETENNESDDHHGFGVIKVKNTVNSGYNQDFPSEDDVCPICFDSFALPCKSNCGHWFCADCIIQYWMFKSAIRPCKCPMCLCKITNLKNQSDSSSSDDIEMVKRIHKYNALFAGGAYCQFKRVLSLPLYIGEIFRAVINPDRLRCVYYVTRLLGLFLALVYEVGEYEFVPTGGFGIRKAFDLMAIFLVVGFFFAGVAYRWAGRRRLRGVADESHIF